MQLAQWLARHDRNYVALRRAARAAIVLPALFALSGRGLGSAEVATYAAYGTVALLLLVDFGGSMRMRLEAQASLIVAGAAMVCLGTLVSGNAWLASGAMTAVGFAVLFAGVVSSEIAGAASSLLLAFIIAVSVPAPASLLAERLLGWGIAGVASMIAIAVLWPAPAHDRLREGAAAACTALAVRLRADIAAELDDDPVLVADRDRAASRADAATDALSNLFLTMPYRPAALSTTARAVLRLVEEIGWVSALASAWAEREPAAAGIDRRAPCAVRTAAANVLERSAELLGRTAGDARELHAAVAELSDALARLEQRAIANVGEELEAEAASVDAAGRAVHEIATSLDPTFRAQELAFAVLLVARNVDLAAAAERRGWMARTLGRRPTGLSSVMSAARGRATAHVERHSVWLHNSVRGAIALGLSVFVASRVGAEHSFWVIFGALSVLRSSALHTGQNVVRAILGTALGFGICAALLGVIGTNATVLWVLVPFTVLLAGVAPAAISFAAGQAAFTLLVVILFNLIQPAGWRVGLVRIEDIALGCGVSLVVGLLFWPRGARVALRQALAAAYAEGAAYLVAAVEYGMGRCDESAPSHGVPEAAANRASSAERRLDDTFRNFLAERGAKPFPLANLTPLIAGASALRLAGDAVVDLWRDHGAPGPRDRSAARREIAVATTTVKGWYDDLAVSLTDRRPLPDPMSRDEAAAFRMVDALRNDLRSDDGRATETAVRVLWTSDHLDRVRRLEGAIIGAVRAGVERTATEREKGARS